MNYMYRILGITKHGKYDALLPHAHKTLRLDFISITFDAFEDEVLAMQILCLT